MYLILSIRDLCRLSYFHWDRLIIKFINHLILQISPEQSFGTLYCLVKLFSISCILRFKSRFVIRSFTILNKMSQQIYACFELSYDFDPEHLAYLIWYRKCLIRLSFVCHQQLYFYQEFATSEIVFGTKRLTPNVHKFIHSRTPGQSELGTYRPSRSTKSYHVLAIIAFKTSMVIESKGSFNALTLNLTMAYMCRLLITFANTVKPV